MKMFMAVQTSLWPLILSLAVFTLMVNTVLWVNMKVGVIFIMLAGMMLFFLMLLWWKDLLKESMLGYHSNKLEISIRFGMLLFILSEVFFFLSFFWAFYDASLVPCIELGMIWPPKGIIPLVVYSVPLLNTIILLTSGITVTWAHHSIVSNFYFKSLVSLFITVLLGIYFLWMQWLEYNEAMFSIADGIYGSTFFMATGFHGMHVMVGTLFLFYSFLNLFYGKLLYTHHFSFEAAAWYWHFVDVVWLILFISIYYWGSMSFITMND